MHNPLPYRQTPLPDPYRAAAAAGAMFCVVYLTDQTGLLERKKRGGLRYREARSLFLQASDRLDVRDVSLRLEAGGEGSPYDRSAWDADGTLIVDIRCGRSIL